MYQKQWLWLFVLKNDSADIKRGADRDETPPRTPTGNALSSESDIEASSPSNDHVSSSNDIVVSQEEDERLAKELSLKEAAAHDLSHRPKRRRFHESYNFNMKCPTPGCNSLGEGTHTHTTLTLFLLPNHIMLLWPVIFSCVTVLSFLSVLFPSGHLTGRHERHFSISGCPLYHNLSADECKVYAPTQTLSDKSARIPGLEGSVKLGDCRVFSNSQASFTCCLFSCTL